MNSICLECGVNVGLLDGHSPTCSLASEEDMTEGDDTKYGVAAISYLVEAAADRGIVTTRSLISTSLIEEGNDAQTVKKSMDLIDEALHTAGWVGAFTLMQVLIEQELLDEDAMASYIQSVG